MDNIEIILYKTIVYPNVKFNSNTFSKIVNNILKDKRGWENHPKAYNGKYVSFLKVQNDYVDAGLWEVSYSGGVEAGKGGCVRNLQIF